MTSDAIPGAVEETPVREPWRAANLSLVLPGLGQWEMGERSRGLFFIVTSAILWFISGAFLLVPRLPGWVGMIGVFVWVAFGIFAIADAHRRARSVNTPEQEDTRRSHRDAWKTVFLNRQIPGVGHAYEGRWGGAALWLLAYFISWSLPTPLDAFAGAAVMAGVIWRGWTRTRARPVPDKSLVLAVALAAATWTAAGRALPLWLRENVFQAFRIPSESMSPTLQPDDFVFIDKRTFVPRDGDVVVYPYPRDPSKLFIKRVFAVPGEVVEFKADGSYRDGQRLLGGTYGPVMFGEEGHPYRVREGEVFLVGDNLENSNDSRHHGPIPIEKLRGRAYKTFWPPGRARTFP